MLPLLATAAAAAPNVLVLVADDVGVDKIGAYGIGSAYVPRTPTVDGLADDGVLFTHTYGMPTCSPTRATLQTGRLPWRHGVGKALSPRGAVRLHLRETTLAELLTVGTGGAYTSVALGKWHLGAGRGLATHALDQGYDWYAGQMGDLGESHSRDGLPQDYFDWEKNTNGVFTRVDTYATTDTVDDAVAQLDALEPPWLLWVAFNAAHAPWHDPPGELSSGADGATDLQRRYNAAVEAIDTEVGRLLDHLDDAGLADTTTVVFLGDNGSPPDAASPPYDADHAKGSVYEGGIRIPLVVRGPWVAEPGRRVEHLVQASDLFATVADLARIDLDRAPLEHDSVSIVPYLVDRDAPARRHGAYSESFGPVSGPYTFTRRMMRNDQYKLVETWEDGVGVTRELYDIGRDDAEGPDLMVGVLTPPQRTAYFDLLERMPWDIPE